MQITDRHRLGPSSLEVSPLCLGCLNFGGSTGEPEALRILERAFARGLNFVDTAAAYQEGRSEEILGRFFRRSGTRADVVIATKVHAPHYDPDPRLHRDPGRHFRRHCEDSLRRLRTDTIDLYQLHWPQVWPEGLLEESLAALAGLVAEGKVRHLGWTTIAAWQVVEFQRLAREHGGPPFVSQQIPYHLLDRRPERETLPATEYLDLGVLAWSPLAGGFLSGKYRRGERPDPPRWGLMEEHFSAASFDVLDEVQSLASEKGVSAAQVALAWCMGNADIDCPTLGPRTVEHLEDALGALEVSLHAEDRQRLDEVSTPGGHIVPYHIADFGPGRFLW